MVLPVLPSVVSPQVPIIFAPAVPVAVLPAGAINIPAMAVPAHRLRHLPEIAMTTFRHNEFPANESRLMGENRTRNRRNKVYRPGQGLDLTIAIPACVVIVRMAVYFANLGAKWGYFPAPADDLAEQRAAPGADKDSAAPVFTGFRRRRQDCQDKCRSKRYFDVLHVLFLPTGFR
jgi:hypothetical protein